MTDTEAARRSPLRSIGRTIVNLMLVATVVLTAAWVVPAFLGYERYVITGGSMSGTFEKGAVVFEKPVAVSDLRVGDVITYLPPADSGVTSLVTHRIVSMKPSADGTGSLLRTRGDANASTDPWKFSLVETTQPVVEFHVPLVGYALIALADRDLRMALVGAPAALIALLALGELVRALRRGEPLRSATA